MWKAAFTGRSETGSVSARSSAGRKKSSGGASVVSSSSRKPEDDKRKSRSGSAYDDEEKSSATYATAPTSRAGLTESAVRMLDQDDDDWEDDDKDARSERKNVRSGEGRRHHRKHSEKERNETRSRSRERRRSSRKEAEVAPSGKSKGGLDAGQERGIPEMGSFEQFPGQYAGGVMGSAGQQDTMMSGALQHGPPSAPDNQLGPTRADSYGHAADYYLDEGQSVSYQPGVRANSPNMLVNPDHHLMAASAEEHPAEDTGHGSAADFYDGRVSPVFTEEPEQIKPGKQPFLGSGRPSKSSATSSLGSAGAVTAAALGGLSGAAALNGLRPSQSQNQNQTTATSSTSYQQMNGSSSSNRPQTKPDRQNSAPVGSSSAGGTYYGPPPQNQYQNQSMSGKMNTPGKQPSHSNAGTYAAVAAAAGAAGLAAYEINQHHQQSSSSQYGGMQSARPPPSYGHTTGQHTAYTNGDGGAGMDHYHYHEHKGPMTKLKDGLLNLLSTEEDVVKMEMYTEYIGVCKHCFDPRTSPYDAPRRHHYHSSSRRDSFEELRRRRSLDRMRRAGSREQLGRTTVGSTRVDKDSRYYADAKRRSGSKTDLIGAGLAAAGVAAGASAMMNHDRKDFDDTYSVKSGHRESSAVRRRSRSSSRERRIRSSYGVAKQDGKEEFAYVRTKDGRMEKRRVQRSRSRSRDRKTGLIGTAAGAALGTSVVGAASSSSRRRRSRSRSRSHSPGFGLSDSKSKRSRRSPNGSYYDVSRQSRQQRPQESEGGMFGGFFSPPGPRRRNSRREHRKKKTGFFNFGNGSSSSSEEGLAFGEGSASKTSLPLRRKSSTRHVRKKSDEHLAAAVAGIGATAAALAAAQKGHRISKRSSKPELGARKDVRHHQPALAASDDEWEDELPSDVNDVSSNASGLAFGDYDRRVSKRQSMESIGSNRSSDDGLSAWGWRWGGKDKKRDKYRPSAPSPTYPTRPGVSPMGSIGAGLAAGAVASAAMDAAGRPMRSESVTSGVSQQPMQYVDPRPISDAGSISGSRHSAMPGAFDDVPVARPGPAPLQQPKPVAPINPSFTQSPPEMDAWEAQAYRPAKPRRTQSSPSRSSFAQDAALIGAAAIGTAGIIASQAGRDRKGSKDVRFGLTDEQQAKDDRERRRQREKAADEERRRADRARALKEEAERHTREQDVLRQREQENRMRAEAELERQRAAQREADEQAEVDRQRELERSTQREDVYRKQEAAKRRERREREQREQEVQAEIERKKRELEDQQRYERDRRTEERRQYERRQEEESRHSSSVPWGAVAAGTAAAVGGAALYEHEHHKDRDIQDGAGRIEEIKPTEQGSGSSIMDDDIMDPDYFKRKRSDSDYRRHIELARKAADKVVADQEAYYAQKPQSQADFFAPKEILAMRAEGKERAGPKVDPNDEQVQVYHAPDKEIRSHFDRELYEVQDYGRSRHAPYGVPRLGLIAPTPPPSALSSGRKTSRSSSPLAQREGSAEHVEDISAPADVEAEPEPATPEREEKRRSRKGSRSRSVSWGGDQTHVYDVPTPDSHHERDSYIENHDIPSAAAGSVAGIAAAAAAGAALHEVVVEPSSPGEGPKKRTYREEELVGKNTPGDEDEDVEEIRDDETPPIYRQPFYDSVSDVGFGSFAIDSPGTEGAPLVRGFVEGEVDEPTPATEKSPHVPGGFDEEEEEEEEEPSKPAPSSESRDVSKMEDDRKQRVGDYFESAAEPIASDSKAVRTPEPEAEAEPAWEPPLTKREKRKREKAAKRASALDNDISESTATMPETPPTREIDEVPVQEPEAEPEWQPPLSKKDKKKLGKQAKRQGFSDVAEAMMTAGGIAAVAGAAVAADKDSESSDGKKSKKGKKKAREPERDIRDMEPSHTVIPEVSEQERTGMPGGWDTETKEKGAESLSEIVDPFQYQVHDDSPAQTLQEADPYAEFETPKKSKNKKKRDSLRFSEPAASSPLRSEVAFDDYIGGSKDAPSTEATQTVEPVPWTNGYGQDYQRGQAETTLAYIPSATTETEAHVDDRVARTSKYEADDRRLAESPSHTSPDDLRSVASDPTGERDSRRKSKSERSKRESDYYDEPETYDDTKSVAASEPADAYATSRKSKRRSRHEDDDTASVVSSRSRGDTEESTLSTKKDKKGSFFGLFSRKSSDGVPLSRQSTKDSKEDEYDDRERRHRRHKHRDSEYGDEDDARSVVSESKHGRHRSRSERDDDAGEGGRSSRYGDEDQEGEHHHHHRRRTNESDYALSRTESEGSHRHHHHRRRTDEDADQSFLGMRVEDMPPLPDSRPVSPDSAPVKQEQDYGIPVSAEQEETSLVSREHADAFELLREDEEEHPLEHASADLGASDDRTVSREHADAFDLFRQDEEERRPEYVSADLQDSGAHTVSRDHADTFELLRQDEDGQFDHAPQGFRMSDDHTVSGDHTDAFDLIQQQRPTEGLERSFSRALHNRPQPSLEDAVEYLPALPDSRPGSPSTLDETETPQRPTSLQRPTSATAVPLRFPFGHQPLTPSPRLDRAASFAAPAPSTPASPSTQKTRQGRPASTEIRPLYLVERNRKTPEVEELLPSLPSSKPSSRASSLVGSEEYESATEDIGSPERRRNLTIDTYRANERPEDDYLDSQQTTPRATEFPQSPLGRPPRPEPQFYTWEDFEQDARLHRTASPEQDGAASIATYHEPAVAGEHERRPTAPYSTYDRRDEGFPALPPSRPESPTEPQGDHVKLAAGIATAAAVVGGAAVLTHQTLNAREHVQDSDEPVSVEDRGIEVKPAEAANDEEAVNPNTAQTMSEPIEDSHQAGDVLSNMSTDDKPSFISVADEYNETRFAESSEGSAREGNLPARFTSIPQSSANISDDHLNLAKGIAAAAAALGGIGGTAIAAHHTLNKHERLRASDPVAPPEARYTASDFYHPADENTPRPLEETAKDAPSASGVSNPTEPSVESTVSEEPASRDVDSFVESESLMEEGSTSVQLAQPEIVPQPKPNELDRFLHTEQDMEEGDIADDGAHFLPMDRDLPAGPSGRILSKMRPLAPSLTDLQMPEDEPNRFVDRSMSRVQANMPEVVTSDTATAQDDYPAEAKEDIGTGGDVDQFIESEEQMEAGTANTARVEAPFPTIEDAAASTASDSRDISERDHSSGLAIGQPFARTEVEAPSAEAKDGYSAADFAPKLTRKQSKKAKMKQKAASKLAFEDEPMSEPTPGDPIDETVQAILPDQPQDNRSEDKMTTAAPPTSVVADPLEVPSGTIHSEQTARSRPQDEFKPTERALEQPEQIPVRSTIEQPEPKDLWNSFPNVSRKRSKKNKKRQQQQDQMLPWGETGSEQLAETIAMGISTPSTPAGEETTYPSADAVNVVATEARDQDTVMDDSSARLAPSPKNVPLPRDEDLEPESGAGPAPQFTPYDSNVLPSTDQYVARDISSAATSEPILPLALEADEAKDTLGQASSQRDIEDDPEERPFPKDDAMDIDKVSIVPQAAPEVDRERDEVVAVEDSSAILRDIAADSATAERGDVSMPDSEAMSSLEAIQRNDDRQIALSGEDERNVTTAPESTGSTALSSRPTEAGQDNSVFLPTPGDDAAFPEQQAEDEFTWTSSSKKKGKKGKKGKKSTPETPPVRSEKIEQAGVNTPNQQAEDYFPEGNLPIGGEGTSATVGQDREIEAPEDFWAPLPSKKKGKKSKKPTLQTSLVQDDAAQMVEPPSVEESRDPFMTEEGPVLRTSVAPPLDDQPSVVDRATVHEDSTTLPKPNDFSLSEEKQVSHEIVSGDTQERYVGLANEPSVVHEPTERELTEGDDNSNDVTATAFEDLAPSEREPLSTDVGTNDVAEAQDADSFWTLFPSKKKGKKSKKLGGVSVDDTTSNPTDAFDGAALEAPEQTTEAIPIENDNEPKPPTEMEADDFWTTSVKDKKAKKGTKAKRDAARAPTGLQTSDGTQAPAIGTSAAEESPAADDQFEPEEISAEQPVPNEGVQDRVPAQATEEHGVEALPPLPASPLHESYPNEPSVEEYLSRKVPPADLVEIPIQEPSALPDAQKSLADVDMAEAPVETYDSPARLVEHGIGASPLEQQGSDETTGARNADADPGKIELARNQVLSDPDAPKSIVSEEPHLDTLQTAQLDDNSMQATGDLLEETPLPYVTKKSKKDRKKAKKSRSSTADYWAEDPAEQEEQAVRAESEDTFPPTRQTIVEEATAAGGIGAVLGTEAIPDEPRELDNEWSGFSTKRSKKDKRKTKKSGTSTPPVGLESDRAQPVSEPMEISQDESLIEASQSISAANMSPEMTSAVAAEPMKVEHPISDLTSRPEEQFQQVAESADRSMEPTEIPAEPFSGTEEPDEPVSSITRVADPAGGDHTLSEATDHDILMDRIDDPVHVSLPEDVEEWSGKADIEALQAFQPSVEREISPDIGQETVPTTAIDPASAVPAMEPQRDVDFTATVAAGLADSGFDPDMVFHSPAFQRRATRPGAVGEAYPEEFFATVGKKKSKGRKGKSSAEVASFKEVEQQAKSSEPPPQEQPPDDFNATLERSLAGTGFDTALLQQAASSSNDVSSNEVTGDPTEFSLSTPKRKKGKRSKKVQYSMTPDIPADPSNADPQALEDENKFDAAQSSLPQTPTLDDVPPPVEQRTIQHDESVGEAEPVRDLDEVTRQSSADIRSSEQGAESAYAAKMDVEDPAATLAVGGEREMDVDEMDKAYKAFKKNKRNKKKQKYAAFQAPSEPETPMPETESADKSQEYPFTQEAATAEREVEQVPNHTQHIADEDRDLPADVGFDVTQYGGAKRPRYTYSQVDDPGEVSQSGTRPEGYLHTSEISQFLPIAVERISSRSRSAERNHTASSLPETVFDRNQAFDDSYGGHVGDGPAQHPESMASGTEATNTADAGVGAALGRARSRNRDRTPDSAHHGRDRSLGLLPNDRHHSPSRSFENLENEDRPLPESPVLGSKEHEIARDSGYQEVNTPLLQRQSSESTRSPLPQIHASQSRESLHSRRSAEPLRISTDTGPDWDLNVPKKRDNGEVERQTETLRARTPSRETPLESTTKNRASYLFQTTPETLKEYSAPSDLPTPSQKSEGSDYFRTRSRCMGLEDDDNVGDRSASISERAAFSPPPTGTMSPLHTIPEEHHAHKRTIGETDVKGPETIKAIRRTETPQAIRARERALSPRALPSVTIPLGSSRSVSNPLSTDELIHRLSWPAVDEDNGIVNIDRSLKRKSSRPVPLDHRSPSVVSNRSNTSGGQFRSPEELRSYSRISNRSSTPTLRRIDRSLSGDLRAASRRGEAGSAVGARSSPKTIPFEPPPTPPSNDDELIHASASRSADMSDIYQGYGDAQAAQVSPTRPPNMRKRQSMHIMELESKLDELVAENQALHDAKQTCDVPDVEAVNEGQQMQEALNARDLQLREKDHEINQIRVMLQPMQEELARLTEINDGLTEANRNLVDDTNGRYATLQQEHAHAHEQWQSTSRELDGMRQEHGRLNIGMKEIVETEIATALADKNSEIRQLREELDVASEKIRALQVQIQSTKSRNFLTVRDDDYFDGACQKLCQHVQQWVLRFSKLSDDRICRLYVDVKDEKIEARLDNAMVDGSDVDKLLSDRTRRRDVFMSVVMTIVWEYVFTRYLFGMERDQRQKLKQLEKLLVEVGPPRAVAQWRATTLTLLSKRPSFAQQREFDTEAVKNEIFGLLCALLPPPANTEQQLLASLQKVIGIAVDLSIEMRTQRAEYIMLPPLQPEYDTNGDLVHKYHFKALLMNERSGMFSSNEELEESRAVVKIVLFPLVVRKGNELGEGEDEIVVCPAQVLVHNDNSRGKKIVRVQSGAMEIDDPRRSRQSLVSTTGGSMAF